MPVVLQSLGTTQQTNNKNSILDTAVLLATAVSQLLSWPPNIAPLPLWVCTVSQRQFHEDISFAILGNGAEAYAFYYVKHIHSHCECLFQEESHLWGMQSLSHLQSISVCNEVLFNQCFGTV